jgi:predicted metal-binding protein
MERCFELMVWAWPRLWVPWLLAVTEMCSRVPKALLLFQWSCNRLRDRIYLDISSWLLEDESRIRDLDCITPTKNSHMAATTYQSKIASRPSDATMNSDKSVIFDKEEVISDHRT